VRRGIFSAFTAMRKHKAMFSGTLTIVVRANG